MPSRFALSHSGAGSGQQVLSRDARGPLPGSICRALGVTGHHGAAWCAWGTPRVRGAAGRAEPGAVLSLPSAAGQTGGKGEHPPRSGGRAERGLKRRRVRWVAANGSLEKPPGAPLRGDIPRAHVRGSAPRQRLAPCVALSVLSIPWAGRDGILGLPPYPERQIPLAGPDPACSYRVGCKSVPRRSSVAGRGLGHPRSSTGSQLSHGALFFAFPEQLCPRSIPGQEACDVPRPPPQGRTDRRTVALASVSFPLGSACHFPMSLLSLRLLREKEKGSCCWREQLDGSLGEKRRKWKARQML